MLGLCRMIDRTGVRLYLERAFRVETCGQSRDLGASSARLRLESRMRVQVTAGWRVRARIASDLSASAGSAASAAAPHSPRRRLGGSSASVRAMADDSSDEGLRRRIARSGEDALGKLAQDLLENSLVNGAITRAFEAREKAAQAQEVAMGALNLPSAADIERLTRRVRSVSQRLEGIEDGVDRLDRSLTSVSGAVGARGAPRGDRAAARGDRRRRGEAREGRPSPLRDGAPRRSPGRRRRPRCRRPRPSDDGPPGGTARPAGSTPADATPD